MDNLGNYLSVPLFHGRATNSTLRFVVVNVRNKLQSWEARQLSLAGRATLAQVVLFSILTYFMQSMMIPKGICKEIKRMTRKFIWGASNGSKKLALVSWDSVYQPQCCGDLGFKQLRDHNTSFLLKLGFNIVLKDNALWVCVLRSKYNMKERLLESIT